MQKNGGGVLVVVEMELPRCREREREQEMYTGFTTSAHLAGQEVSQLLITHTHTQIFAVR